MADEYSTPIPQGATVGTAQAQSAAQPAPTSPAQSSQPAADSQSQDEYTAPIPQDATIGDTPHQPAADPDAEFKKHGYDILGGIAESAGQTVNTISKGISKIAPSVVRPNDVAGLSQMESADSPGEKVGMTAESIGEFFMGDEVLKGLSLAQKYAKIGKLMEAVEESPTLRRVVNLGIQSVRQGTVTAGQQLLHGSSVSDAAKTGAEATAAGGITGAITEALSSAIPAGYAKVTHYFHPDHGVVSVEDNSGLVKQILQGDKAAQPKAQQAVRQAVQTGADAAGTTDAALTDNIAKQPLLGQGKTILDDHLNKLQGKEQAAYNEMDEAAGFDVKAEKQNLANDKYKLQQLGNTDSDVTQRGNLIDSINDSEGRITAAEAKMQAAGVDPGAADALHKQRMAGQEFKKILVNNASSDGQTVNVDGLLTASKKLRLNSKYGDRLAQFFGNADAADKFEADLLSAQKTGQTALSRQNVAKILGKYVGLPLVGTGVGSAVYEATHSR